MGETVEGAYRLRKGTQPGDVLCVTGCPGLSAAGLQALLEGRSAPELRQAHLHPVPRIAEGQWLASHAEVHAMLDVSDGLLQDAGILPTQLHWAWTSIRTASPRLLFCRPMQKNGDGTQSPSFCQAAKRTNWPFRFQPLSLMPL